MAIVAGDVDPSLFDVSECVEASLPMSSSSEPDTFARCLDLQSEVVRKVAERKFPEFFEFSSRIFFPNFAPNFPRIFQGLFVLRFVGDGDQKKFAKNPRHFSMQNSQANTEKYSQNSSGEQAK